MTQQKPFYVSYSMTIFPLFSMWITILLNKTILYAKVEFRFLMLNKHCLSKSVSLIVFFHKQWMFRIKLLWRFIFLFADQFVLKYILNKKKSMCQVKFIWTRVTNKCHGNTNTKLLLQWETIQLFLPAWNFSS